MATVKKKKKNRKKKRRHKNCRVAKRTNPIQGLLKRGWSSQAEPECDGRGGWWIERERERVRKVGGWGGGWYKVRGGAGFKLVRRSTECDARDACPNAPPAVASPASCSADNLRVSSEYLSLDVSIQSGCVGIFLWYLFVCAKTRFELVENILFFFL